MMVIRGAEKMREAPTPNAIPRKLPGFGADEILTLGVCRIYREAVTDYSPGWRLCGALGTDIKNA